MKGPTEKLIDYVGNPKEIGRDLEDAKDVVGDVVHDRGAREIYPREIGKKISRTTEDVKDRYKVLLDD